MALPIGWSRVGWAVGGGNCTPQASGSKPRCSTNALGPTGPRPVRAPMPGLVVRVEVSLGDVITAGQGVAIVEAMKMENELTADGEGRVSAILVAEGDTVERDQVLVELTSLKEDASLTRKASQEPRNA